MLTAVRNGIDIANVKREDTANAINMNISAGKDAGDITDAYALLRRWREARLKTEAFDSHW